MSMSRDHPKACINVNMKGLRKHPSARMNVNLKGYEERFFKNVVTAKKWIDDADCPPWLIPRSRLGALQKRYDKS